MIAEEEEEKQLAQPLFQLTPYFRYGVFGNTFSLKIALDADVFFTTG